MQRKPTKDSSRQAQPTGHHYAAQISQNVATFPDGQVTWTTIDDVCVPCIIRNNKQHGPVRILEEKLLNRLPTTIVNIAFRNRHLLVSTYLTDFEALQLTRVVSGQYGTFTDKDLVVNVDQFRELYAHIKSMPVLRTATPPVTGGWLQVNNSVIPYVNASQSKLLPLAVVTNAAGLLCNISSGQLQLYFPTEGQCRYLNELCSLAGLDFTFDRLTSLVDVTVMCALTSPTPYTRELPSNDPFSHAQYIGEGVVCPPTSTPAAYTTNLPPANAPATAVSYSPNVFPTLQQSQIPQVLGSVVSRPDDQSLHTLMPTVIEPVSFRDRTISSLYRPTDGNRYVLLDAVCRVFFPNQTNVDAFLRSAETLFRIPDVRMSSDEEQQFIRFYKLPTDQLKHNRLIALDLLTNIFPYLVYMFSSEVDAADGRLIGTVLPRLPNLSTAASDAKTVQASTITANNVSNDVAKPRKRRRNDFGNEVLVID